MTFDLIVAAVGAVAGAIAAVAGFGIGSLLTPTVALQTGTKLAVAAIAIPHFLGTLQRYWFLRQHVDRRVLLGFGLASAAGGLAGALAHVWLSSGVLTIVFGALLILAALAEATGWMQKVHWGRRVAWLAGALSGAFGGLVGNQGSIRSAAMLGFDVPKESFVATATAMACSSTARVCRSTCLRNGATSSRCGRCSSPQPRGSSSARRSAPAS